MKHRYVNFSKVISGFVLSAVFGGIFYGCFTEPDPLNRFDAPEPPVDLTVVVGEKNAELTWSPPASPVSHYLVALADHERTQIYSDTTSADSFTFNNLSPGIVCYTAVSSVSEAGIESSTTTPIQGQKMIPGRYVLYPADGDTIVSTPQVEFALDGPEEMEFIRLTSIESLVDSTDWIPFHDSVDYALPCSTTGYYPVYARLMDRTGFLTSILSCSLFYDPGI